LHDATGAGAASFADCHAGFAAASARCATFGPDRREKQGMARMMH
jgi:hypothetical protein